MNEKGETIMKKPAFLLTILALIVGACAAPPAAPTTAPAVAPTTAPAAAPTAEQPQAGTLPDLGGKVLRFAEEPFPPYTDITADGTLTGFEIDFIKEICRRLNCVPEFKIIGVQGAIPGLTQGEYDVVAAGTVDTPEREKVVDFTDPYYISAMVVIMRSDETRITTPEDLLKPGIITGELTGTSAERLAVELGIPEEQLKHFDGTTDVPILALRSGDIDANIDSVEVADEWIKKYEGKLAILSDAKGPLSISGHDALIAFAVQKGNSELREALNAAIAQLIQDGTLAGILKKYGVTVSLPK
jgi:polar amino acid transport system substrate-binding protein